jgi:hypothetical protein
MDAYTKLMYSRNQICIARDFFLSPKPQIQFVLCSQAHIELCNTGNINYVLIVKVL